MMHLYKEPYAVRLFSKKVVILFFKSDRGSCKSNIRESKAI